MMRCNKLPRQREILAQFTQISLEQGNNALMANENKTKDR